MHAVLTASSHQFLMHAVLTLTETSQDEKKFADYAQQVTHLKVWGEILRSNLTVGDSHWDTQSRERAADPYCSAYVDLACHHHHIIISGFGIYGAAVVDGVDAGSGTLYMPVPPKTPSAKNSRDLVYIQFLVKHSRGNLIFQLCTADPPDHGTVISADVR